MMNSLVIPFFGMMGLTIVVWVYMYARRLSYVLAKGISAQDLTTPEKLNQLVPESINAPSNNLKNLFELPVLFYAVCFYQFLIGEPSAIVVYCAYGFLGFRILHSLIHCTLNRVLWRFAVYLISALALFGMIIAEFGQFVSRHPIALNTLTDIAGTVISNA